MKKDYRIFKKAGKNTIENNDIIRVDLFNSYNIRDIEELKGFNFIYEQKGHNDSDRAVRYIKVFRKNNI